MFRLSKAMHSQDTHTNESQTMFACSVNVLHMYFLSKILLCYLLNNLFCTNKRTHTHAHTHTHAIYCEKVITATSYIPSWYECYPICVCNHTCLTCDGMHVFHRFQFCSFDIFNEHSVEWRQRTIEWIQRTKFEKNSEQEEVFPQFKIELTKFNANYADILGGLCSVDWIYIVI